MAQKLIWWRGPARLEDDDVVMDAAAAERYDADTLGPELLFDFAAMPTPRALVDFVERYGPLWAAPSARDPRQDIEQTLTLARFYENQLYALALCQQDDAPPEVRAEARARDQTEALRLFFAGQVPPPVDGTLAGVIKRQWDALEVARVQIRRCLNCARWFHFQHRAARYCSKACAGTAASWRERRRPAAARAARSK